MTYIIRKLRKNYIYVRHIIILRDGTCPIRVRNDGWPVFLVYIVRYNSASVHRTAPKIPPFDSRGNYHHHHLFEYLNIIGIQSNLGIIFTNIYQCFDFRTEIPTNYIFNNNIRANSCTICHFHARYLLYKVSYFIYFTLTEFLSSSSIF